MSKDRSVDSKKMLWRISLLVVAAIVLHSNVALLLLYTRYIKRWAPVWTASTSTSATAMREITRCFRHGADARSVDFKVASTFLNSKLFQKGLHPRV